MPGTLALIITASYGSTFKGKEVQVQGTIWACWVSMVIWDAVLKWHDVKDLNDNSTIKLSNDMNEDDDIHDLWMKSYIYI